MLEEISDIMLYNQRAEPIELKSFLKSKSLILFIYPSNRNSVFIDILKELDKLKVEVIAISSDSVDQNLNVAGINKLNLNILSDPSKVVAKRLGLITINNIEIFTPAIFLFLEGKLEKKRVIYSINDYIIFLNSIKDYL